MSNLIEARGLKKYFTSGRSLFGRKKTVYAVDGVDLEINEGETLGLVGESGCGKTTLGRMLLRLIEPTLGEVRFEGHNILELKEREMKEVRRKTGIVFQDPISSLNPRRSIRQTLSLPFQVHTDLTAVEIHDKVAGLLEAVGLTPPELYVDRYPHEFSGGQRQRIGIARAIALYPKFVVADEPVSALDLSIRAQILSLMRQLQKQLKLAYLFITHDLSVLRSVTHRIAVMYLGRVVETASVEDLYNDPLHPYTQALLLATPVPRPGVKIKRMILLGEVPSATSPPPGCRFHTRCPYAFSRCSKEEPKLLDRGGGHLVACHLYD